MRGIPEDLRDTQGRSEAFQVVSEKLQGCFWGFLSISEAFKGRSRGFQGVIREIQGITGAFKKVSANFRSVSEDYWGLGVPQDFSSVSDVSGGFRQVLNCFWGFLGRFRAIPGTFIKFRQLSWIFQWRSRGFGGFNDFQGIKRLCMRFSGVLGVF